MPLYRIGQKNVLFIHVPKTAGMAVAGHLDSFGPCVFDQRIPFAKGVFPTRHQPASVLQAVFMPQMIDYAFLVTRHPVARLVSEYRYQRRHGGLQLARMRLFGFDLWLRHAMFRLRSNPRWRNLHFLPQVDYPCFGAETFRYEDGLSRVIRRLSEVTGVTMPDTPAATNQSVPRPVHVSQSSLDLIAQYYAADFERFDYRVEVPALPGVTGPQTAPKLPQTAA